MTVSSPIERLERDALCEVVLGQLLASVESIWNGCTARCLIRSMCDSSATSPPMPGCGPDKVFAEHENFALTALLLPCGVAGLYSGRKTAFDPIGVGRTVP